MFFKRKPKRPDPKQFNAGQIIAQIHLKDGEVIEKVFSGYGEEYKYWSLFDSWHPDIRTADMEYEKFLKDTKTIGFFQYAYKDYPLAEIHRIDLTDKEYLVLIS